MTNPTLEGNDAERDGSSSSLEEINIDASIYSTKNATANSSDSTSNSTDSNADSASDFLTDSFSKGIKGLWCQCVLLAVVIALGVVATILVHSYTAGAEQENFDEKFQSETEKIFLAIGRTMDLRMSLSDAYMHRLVAYAHSIGSEFPYAVIPDFCVETTKVLALMQSIAVQQFIKVTRQERDDWANFTAANNWWVNDCIDVQEHNPNFHGPILRDYTITDVMYDHGGPLPENASGPFLPTWGVFPVIPYWPPYGWDGASYGDYSIPISTAMDTLSVVVSPISNYVPPGDAEAAAAVEGFVGWASDFIPDGEDPSEPFTEFYYPIHSAIQDVFLNITNDQEFKTYGVLSFTFYWRQVLQDLITEGDSGGVSVTMTNPCGNQVFSYLVEGRDPTFVGYRGVEYGEMCETKALQDLSNLDGEYSGVPLNADYCPYTIIVCPSQAMEDYYITSEPAIYTGAVALVSAFLAVTIVLLVYGLEITRRQKKTLETALQARNIVNDLFPASIQDRVMKQQSNEKDAYTSNKLRVKSFVNDGMNKLDHADYQLAPPIADLYTDTTIMFADVAGFTPWSSTRDPTQVFLLLQAVYQTFDKIAQRRKVFKVETVGDCYMAACGVPDANPRHAVLMARFAQECLYAFNKITRQLEVRLGPDTGDLRLRIGMNSGPCTAGVLQGARARFQLFGNTVNMAARMESHGSPNRIHLSKTTADLLVKADKASWVTPNTEAVHVKGKGVQDTFWLVPQSQYACSEAGSILGTASSSSGTPKEVKKANEKLQRLIDWNVQALSNLLKRVVARRNAILASKDKCQEPKEVDVRSSSRSTTRPLDEVRDIIKLPTYNGTTARAEVDPDTVILDPVVVNQLHAYVTEISKLYHHNPFHNFEHASHVASSVEKLLKRIVAPDIDVSKAESAAMGLHDYSYGITSDPLTQFGVVFSALIHDVDHRGVSNVQLGKERPELNEHYQGKSLAEQNSVDIAWELLMKEDFRDLRHCIYGNNIEDMKRFRKIVVSVVLATDIFDKELNDLRKGRWTKAFSDELEGHPDHKDFKATIVIEHLIQASDVAHTMQHWQVYRKWNERLFLELYHAYRAGRMGADPSNFWAKGEIGFFDNYIIPLAKKLKECNVFGVSSDEYLNYALENREEWAAKGEAIVEELKAKYCSEEESMHDVGALADILEDAEVEDVDGLDGSGISA